MISRFCRFAGIKIVSRLRGVMRHAVPRFVKGGGRLWERPFWWFLGFLNAVDAMCHRGCGHYGDFGSSSRTDSSHPGI